jgi:flavin-dependent dehydrogenase
VAATRAGDDGEPELLLHADLSGYSWNVPKSDWLNLGCGVDEPRAVRAAWTAARAHFADCGHLPPSAAAALDQPRGYTYHLFRPERFDRCHRDGAFLVGDALGLAHPLTAEGIAPAAWSGRLCAEAILAGAPASYGRRLAAHPLLADYARVHRLRELASALRRLAPTARGPGRAAPGPLVAASRRAIAGGFAWMFAGKPIPAGRALDPLAWVLERGLGSPLARALAARSRSPGDTPC